MKITIYYDYETNVKEVAKLVLNKEKKSLIHIITEQIADDQKRANQQSKRVRKDIDEQKKRMEERRKKFTIIRNK